MLPHDFLSSPMPTCTPLNMGHPPRSAASEASASTLAAAFDSPLPDSSQSAVRAAQRERSAQQFRPFRAAPPTDLYGAASRTAEQQASGGAQRSAPVECDDDDVEVDAKGTRKPRPEYKEWRKDALADSTLRAAFFGVSHVCKRLQPNGKGCDVGIWSGDPDDALKKMRQQRVAGFELCQAHDRRPAPRPVCAAARTAPQCP
jgi:hypothetical protein